MVRIGFDNKKYIRLQSQNIAKRVSKFNKLYLEFGGKLFDDNHASRVLPGFEPDSKIKMLLKIKDKVEMVLVINADDIEKNKLISVIAYLGVLVMIPLFIARESRFARFHTNQGLVLFLFGLISYAAGLVPYIGWIIGAAVSIFKLLLVIVGVLNAIKGEAKELPVIGKIKILK